MEQEYRKKNSNCQYSDDIKIEFILESQKQNVASTCVHSKINVWTYNLLCF